MSAACVLNKVMQKWLEEGSGHAGDYLIAELRKSGYRIVSDDFLAALTTRIDLAKVRSTRHDEGLYAYNQVAQPIEVLLGSVLEEAV